jgi:hypothetical protein
VTQTPARFGAIAAGLLLIGAAAACAQPDQTPAGTPEVQRSMSFSAQRVPAAPLSGAFIERGYRITGSCAALQPPPQATPGPLPGGEPGGLSDAEARRRAEALERARLVLEAANPPVPRRGDMPAATVIGAEQCVNQLRVELTRRVAGSRTAPSIPDIRSTMESIGLTAVTVNANSRGPSFAGSTGAACLLGTFTADKPTFAIAPLPTAGGCHPD